MTPFAEALGDGLDLPEAVREHFFQPYGTTRYRGTMQRVWKRAGWRGWLAQPALCWASAHDSMLSRVGRNIPFELEHVIAKRQNGKKTMTWTRYFSFPQGKQRFHAMMVFDQKRKAIIDFIGKDGRLEVELQATIEGEGLTVRSGRQWLHLGTKARSLRIPLPGWLVGTAIVREWQTPEGNLAIRAVIKHALLGEFFGYEGTFERHP